MFRNIAKSVPFILVMSLAGLISFTAVAFAADQTVPADGSLLDLLSPVWDAFAHGKYLPAGCLAVVAAVALIRRYGDKWKWVHTDAGSAGLVLAGALGATLAASLATQAFSLELLWSAFKIAAGAAGGYTLIKHLVIEPLLKPLQSKLPAWAQPLLSVLLWAFDRPSASTDGDKAIVKAEAAGQAAVAASPAQGAASVIGKPTEIN